MHDPLDGPASFQAIPIHSPRDGLGATRKECLVEADLLRKLPSTCVTRRPKYRFSSHEVHWYVAANRRHEANPSGFAKLTRGWWNLRLRICEAETCSNEPARPSRVCSLGFVTCPIHRPHGYSINGSGSER